jgi:GNAT superfamily N-acetyltransferase
MFLEVALVIIYKTSLLENEWVKLVDHYEETGMCLGLGKEREIGKIRRAFESSHKYITAWDSEVIIGAGRMISDGECYGWIHDISVLEGYRKKGIGKAIVSSLIEGNESLLIGLTSSFMAIEFYLKLGFNKHKTAMAKYPGKSDYLVY